jgi:hypothetical protein
MYGRVVCVVHMTEGEKMPNDNPKALGTSMAGGAIASALLDYLVTEGIIRPDAARDILQSALISVSQYSSLPEGREAMQTIGVLQSGRFATNR